MDSKQKIGIASVIIGGVALFTLFFWFLNKTSDDEYRYSTRLSKWVHECASKQGSFYERYLTSGGDEGADTSNIVCIKGTEISVFKK